MLVPKLLQKTVLFLTFSTLVIGAPFVLALQDSPPTLMRTILSFVYGLPLMMLELVYVPIVAHTFDLTSYTLKRTAFAVTVAALLWPIPAFMFTKAESPKRRIYWKWWVLLLLGTAVSAVWLALDPNQLTSYVTP